MRGMVLVKLLRHRKNNRAKSRGDSNAAPLWIIPSPGQAPFASLGGQPFRFGGSVPFSPFCFGAASFVPLAASFSGEVGAAFYIRSRSA